MELDTKVSFSTERSTAAAASQGPCRNKAMTVANTAFSCFLVLTAIGLTQYFHCHDSSVEYGSYYWRIVFFFLFFIGHWCCVLALLLITFVSPGVLSRCMSSYLTILGIIFVEEFTRKEFSTDLLAFWVLHCATGVLAILWTSFSLVVLISQPSFAPKVLAMMPPNETKSITPEPRAVPFKV